MREIKFRHWCPDAQEMTDWENIKLLPTDAMLKHVFEPDLLGGFLLEFTGLNSKKGQPIYEGDICTKMISPDENNLAPKELYRGVIEFHYGGFCLKVGDYWYPLSRQHGVIEVIGNIHQNPELL